MSPIRMCCFVTSILVCIVTIVLFLWVVPCDESSTCPAYPDRIKTQNWYNNYTKIELKGVVNVVDGLRRWERNLIFMYRGDKFFPEFEQNNKKRNGIISLIGNSGTIAWFDEMVNEPIAIDCTLIDVDRNGKPDCLVIDEFGHVGAIHPISGQWLWKFSDKAAQKVDVLSFPLILPDLNGDGVYEVIMSTSNGEKTRNSIRIISGRTGEPLGQAYKIKECSMIHKFQLDEHYTISFNCLSNNTEVQRFKSLPELYSLTTNKSLLLNKLVPALQITQHKFYGQRKETEAQRSIYSINGKELIVDNKGKCPENCNVTFILTEERNGAVHVIKNFSGSMMYGMVPAQLSFKTAKSKISGFVMKFWEWSKTTNNVTTGNYHSKRDTDHQNRNEFNIFESFIKKRTSYVIPNDSNRSGRSVSNYTKQKNNAQSNMFFDNNYKMRLIRETQILILFNSGNIHIENTSQSNLVQFCREDKVETVCQPDLNYQENSILIADLDQDDSQELLSYHTTFVNQDPNDAKDWKLVTYIQMLRLESELPALYENFKSD